MFYTNVQQSGNNILFRGYKNGKRILQKVQYTPSLFIESKSGEFKTLNGLINLERKFFDSISEFKTYKEEMENISNLKLYGTMNVIRQFISDYFKEDVEYDINVMNIMSIDIETTTKHGRIDTQNTPEEVTLITMKDFVSKKIVTLGCWDFEYDREKIKKILAKQNLEYDLDRLSNFSYIKCKNEKELLSKFVDILSENYPDIITGYNVEIFDITYLSNRIKKILGNQYLSRCSPWGRTLERLVPINAARSETVVNWFGIEILDYLDLYRKFSYKKLENYKLDTVVEEELQRRKLTHDYDSFREFYEKDPYAFTLYNIIDTDLIDALEERLQLIKLVVSLAYESRTNYTDVYSRLRAWESILYNFMLSKNKVPLMPIENESSNGIMGGYVKEIEPCLREWSVAFDATSLYPSIIMALNMSPETIIDCELEESSVETIEKFVNREIDLNDLIAKDYCCAANGQRFDKSKKGLFPEIVELFFDKRQMFKKMMLKLETENSTDYNTIAMLDIKQLVIKVLINALYGALGNEFFSYFDLRIAEGITMTGQLLTRNAEKASNKYLISELGVEKDYCYYCDTDSVHISLEDIVKRDYNGLTQREISHKLSDYCVTNLGPALIRACDDLDNYLNVYQKGKFAFKREFIASRGVYTAKKRYCLNVLNSEGVEYDPPKMKIMGLEIVRSSTPTSVRKSLKESVRIILTGSNDDLIQYIENFKGVWYTLDYDKIAFPRAVNNLMKYSDGGTFIKGTPMHVKAAITYNRLLEYHDVQDFEFIKDGDRIKFLYLKVPNITANNGIAYNTSIPAQFGLDGYVDYDIILEKAFLHPLSKLTDAIGWELEKKATIMELFE